MAEGKNYSELFTFLASKIPSEIKDVKFDLSTFLQQESYEEISKLYKKTSGDSENEKLESLFKNMNKKKIKELE